MPPRVRPTPVRLRRALFDILGDVAKAPFFDLFAGSGSVGIEALSRGAEPVTFVEVERACCSAIRKNIEAVGLGNKPFRVICAEALWWLARLRPEGGAVFFASPPYIEGFLPSVLEKVLDFVGRWNDLVFVLQFPTRFLPDVFSVPPARIHRVGDDTLIFWER